MPALTLQPMDPQPEALSVEVVVRRGAAELDALGMNWRQIASAHGLDLDSEPSYGKRIATEREYAFLAEAAQAAQDQLFTWRLGAMDLRHYGVAGYAFLNAGTVRQSLDLAEHLIPTTLCDAITYRTVVDGDTATIVYASATSRQNSVFSLRAMLGFLEQVVGPTFAPTRCGLAITEREHLPAVAKQISAPVTADHPFTFVSFPARLLGAPVDGADERLAETLKPFWQREAATLGRGPAAVRSRLEGAIIQNLHLGPPTVDRLGQTLGIGRGRLRADLSAVGGLRALLDQVRRRLASNLLQRHDLPIARVADLLGFSEPDALLHACRRWTNDIPAAFVDGLLERRAAAAQIGAARQR